MASKESIITGAIIILITYTLGLSLISQAFPATQTTQTLSSTGSIQTTANIGVYHDIGCNTPLTSLAWGTLQPGGGQAIVCYIKNEGSSALTLSMYADDWEPDNANDYLDLSWNYDGNPINPADPAVQVTFTLSVDSAIQDITNFSFDITIVGTN